MMTTRVFLLRHGESSDPTVFHGAESDVDLSDRGRRQAEAVARVLKPRRPDLVISSAMRRAVDTAAPIAGACAVDHRLEPDLHERRVAELSRQKIDVEDGIWPETIRRWTSGETSFAHPGAESFDDLQRRLLPAWDRIVRAHAGRTLVVVAHGIVCKVLLLSILEGWTVADWKKLGPVKNAAVSELVQAKGTWQAEVLNRQPEDVAAVE